MKLAIKNARALLQRTRDAKILRGWVVNGACDRLVILVQTKAAVEIADQFSVTVFGHPHQCSATAKVVAKNAISSDAPDTFQFVLQMLTPYAVQRPAEEPRFRVTGISIHHESQVQRECFDAEVVEIGQGGLSVTSTFDFGSGQIFEAAISTGTSEVTASIQVRNHRRLDGPHERYRTGFQILSMDRGDSERWQELFHATVNANFVEIGAAALKSA